MPLLPNTDGSSISMLCFQTTTWTMIRGLEGRTVGRAHPVRLHLETPQDAPSNTVRMHLEVPAECTFKYPQNAPLVALLLRPTFPPAHLVFVVHGESGTLHERQRATFFHSPSKTAPSTSPLACTSCVHPSAQTGSQNIQQHRTQTWHVF